MTTLKRHADLLALALLLAIVAAYAASGIGFGGPPFEDAAMLMRYADHLAHGYGIVWNIGEHPVDGATDFLFMVASAALIRVGVPIGRSVRALGFASHLATVLIVFIANRRLWKAGILASFLSALYLAVGAGLWYVAAFFGTPFFALFATITWVFALLLIRDAAPPVWTSWAFAFSALVTGLIRPEGVILAALMLLSIVLMRGLRASASTIAIFAGVFLVLGGAYFAWRWSYFGQPLPNPFYKKGAGLLHWDSFWESLGYLVKFAGPFTLAFVLAFRSKRTARLAAAMLVSLVGFAAAFILIDNMTNLGGRFQYALWPLVLVAWYPLVRDLPREWGINWQAPQGKAGRAALAAAVLVFAYGLSWYASQSTATYKKDGRYEAAQLLAQYEGKGYVMATTEAGLLPLYSHWSAIDAWGLNDQWIAHHGEITAQYLDQFKPQLIVFHAYFSPLVPPRLIEKNLSQDWFRMTITLKDYAESHGYILAAAFGDSPYEAHYYYVRPDFPDSARIVRQIGSMQVYYWDATGRKSINYAAIQP